MTKVVNFEDKRWTHYLAGLTFHKRGDGEGSILAIEINSEGLEHAGYSVQDIIVSGGWWGHRVGAGNGATQAEGYHFIVFPSSLQTEKSHIVALSRNGYIPTRRAEAASNGTEILKTGPHVRGDETRRHRQFS